MPRTPHKPTIDYRKGTFTRDGEPIEDAFAKLLWGTPNCTWTEKAYLEASDRWSKRTFPGCLPLVVFIFLVILFLTN